MTMFPAQQQLVKQKPQQNYGCDARWRTRLGTCDEGLYNNPVISSAARDQEHLAVVSSSSMGDQLHDEDPDHSTTNSSTNETGGGSITTSNTANNNFILDYTKQARDITDEEDDEGGWLRLGTGSCQLPRSSPAAACQLVQHNQTNNSHGGSGGLMLELNLLQPANTGSTGNLSFQQQTRRTPASSSGGGLMVYQPPQVVQDLQGGWASYLRNPKVLPALSAASSSCNSTSSLLQLQPPQPQPDIIRFIPPPRRPHSGIWFMLLPSFNQVTKQPSLPQLPKNYLRIKDGRMTVGLLIKYLVNKLGLDTESQVEIRCRGMELEGSLTMQHVRDRIWTTSAAASSSMISYPPPTVAAAAHHHIMLLHYATRTTTSTST